MTLSLATRRDREREHTWRMVLASVCVLWSGISHVRMVGNNQRRIAARISRKSEMGLDRSRVGSRNGDATAVARMEAQTMRKGREWRRRVNLFLRQGGLCYWCNRPMFLPVSLSGGEGNRDSMATIDHLDSRLSPERGTHKKEQRTVMAHARCNHDRGHDEEAAQPLWLRHVKSGRFPQSHAL